MPPNGGRGCFEIVVLTDSDKEFELISGLRNAIEHGSTLKSAMQSFVNAGYTQAEVMVAVQKMPTVASQISKQVVAPSETSTEKVHAKSQNNTLVVVSGGKKKLSKTFKITLVVVAVTIIVVAGILGVFWNKLF